MSELGNRDQRISVKFTEDMKERIDSVAEMYQQPASVICAMWITEKVVQLEMQKIHQKATMDATLEKMMPMLEKVLTEDVDAISQSNINEIDIDNK